MTILPRHFYARDILVIAGELLGQVLCRSIGEIVLRGRTVEPRYCSNTLGLSTFRSSIVSVIVWILLPEVNIIALLFWFVRWRDLMVFRLCVALGKYAHRLRLQQTRFDQSEWEHLGRMFYSHCARKRRPDFQGWHSPGKALSRPLLSTKWQACVYFFKQ
jgi:hypothetical protein